MNNYDQHDQIEQEILKHTPRQLARRIIELEENLNKAKADAVREAAKELCEFRGFYHSAQYDEIIDYANKLEKGEV